MGRKKMVKLEVRKRTEYERKYTQKDIVNALKEMEKGTSLRQVSALFKVPRSTLYAKHKNLIPIEAARGPKTYLTSTEENLIVEWIYYCKQRGFPVTKSAVLQCVQKLVSETERETPFKNNMPGRHWWESFCKRHPSVSSKLVKTSNSHNVSPTQDIFKKWYSEVKGQLDNLNLLNIHPSRVFNLAECALYLVPKGDKVLVSKDSKLKNENSANKSITVMFTINAEGTLLPPFIVFQYEKIPSSITKSLPEGWTAGNSETGWMTSDNFYNYITTKFYPWLLQNNIEFPIILYINSYSSNITISLSEFCKAKQIELIALYPNILNVVHPLDVAVFNHLKSSWKTEVDQWKLDNNTQNLKKEYFAPLLKGVLDSTPNLTTIIQKSFQTCGLMPFSYEYSDLKILFQNVEGKFAEQIGYQCDQYNESSEINPDEAEAMKHLKYMERRLGAEVIQDFENALYNGSMEVSDITNQGLFIYWLDIKNACGYMNGSDSISITEEKFSISIDHDDNNCASEEIDINNLTKVEMQTDKHDVSLSTSPEISNKNKKVDKQYSTSILNNILYANLKSHMYPEEVPTNWMETNSDEQHHYDKTELSSKDESIDEAKK